MRKIFSFMLIAAGLLISAQSYAEKDYKFYLGVESGSKVEATVYDDYSFIVNLPSPASVDPAGVTITIKMKNVASLGVTTERSAVKTIETGMDHSSVDLTNWLSNAYNFGGATLNVNIIAEGQILPCSWDIAAWSNGAINASTTTAQTRAAWQLFARQFSTDRQAAEDSYIKIAAGSYLVFGDEKVVFANDLELFKGELDLQQLLNLIENAEIEALGTTGEDTYKPELFVAKGSILAVGQSVAMIDEDMTIRVDASANVGADIVGVLSGIQDDVKMQSSTKSKVFTAVSCVMGLINQVVGIVDNAETVNVDVEFFNPWKVLRGENSLIVAENDHALAIGEIGTFCVPFAVQQVRGGKVYEINERIGAVESVTAMDLVEAEFPLVANRPYIFKATADKLEGFLVGDEQVEEAGDYNGLIGKYEYFDIPSCEQGNLNFMVYQNQLCLCGDGCYINAGLAYVDMNDVPEQGQGNAAPGRAHFTMAGRGATTGTLQHNMIVPANGADRIMIDGHFYIVKDGKLINILGF